MNTNKGINFNFRYNMLIAIVYILGAILLIRLFTMQIIKGEEYRETSNTRLTRESKIESVRGNIYDRNGKTLASSKIGYSLELYKTKADNETLNNTILKIVNLLIKNKDTYVNNFPINSKYEFLYSSEEKIKSWKKKYNINEDATAQECVNRFKQKYEITNDNIEDVLKIIAIRYEITTKGYSTTKSIEIAEDISKKSVIQLNEQNSEFLGINISQNPIRTYTRGTLASHTIGYIGKINEEELKQKLEEGYSASDYVGRAGVEYTFEKYLKGESGTKQIDMSVDGTISNEYIIKEATAGSDITLTIDIDMQEKTEQIIQKNMEELRKLGKKSTFGSAILMNATSGEVLAMCSIPTYNPELFIGGISTEEWKDIQSENKLYNRSVQGAYAPGSTFKMVVATAALEEGVVKESEYVNDRGVYPYAHNPVCWYYTQYHRGHGNVNIKTALQKSCNYFFYEMGRRLGIDRIEKYAKYFGLGEKTGVELPSETTGTLASKKIAASKGEEWYLSDTISAAIGQSYNNFSPIQMARYVSIIANGGNDIRPTVIKKITNANNQDMTKEEIREYVNNLFGINSDRSNVQVSQKTISIVKAGMRLVTSPGGTAYTVFKNFNVAVAGKTGSAQAGNVTNGWFVGFAPYDKPEVALVVILEDGATDSFAIKAAKQILAEYFESDIEIDEIVKEDMSASIYVER